MGLVGPPGATKFMGPIFDPWTYVAAVDDRVYVARGTERQIEVLGPDGRVAGLVRWSGADLRVTEDDVRLWREAELAEARTPGERTAVLRQLEDLPVADRFPALDAMRVDQVGRLWVREYRRPTWGDVQRWLLFDPDGVLACRLEVRGRLQLLDAGSDYLVASWLDDLDVEHVRVYGLTVPLHETSR
jgi:hypothetical protein